MGGELNSNWKTKGATMVEKVAKVRALRETFVEDLGGMYEEEEMDIRQPKEEVVVQQDDVLDSEETLSMDEI